MIYISVEGGTKKQRQLCEDAIRHFIFLMLPRRRSLNIDCKIHNLLIDDMAGLCEHVQGNEFLLELHHRGTLYDFVSYIAHEIIHVKQYLEKELVHRNQKDYWKGHNFTETQYYAQPWEVEAWEMQHFYAKDFIRNKLNTTIKQCKLISPRTFKLMDWRVEHDSICRIIERQEARKNARKNHLDRC
jgi:hypothetical protein